MKLRDLARTVRKRAPQRAVDRLRSGIEAWGTATSAWRMTPDFLIVGAQRSGTTSLYRILNEHPSVVRPTAAKGIGYFDLNYDRGMKWYRGHFPLRAIAAHRAERPVTYESSGYYLFHPLAAKRIARDLPNVKVVVMVREPVERAYSAHRHELTRGFEEQSFETAVALERFRTLGEEDRLVVEPDYQSFEHRHHSYLGRGRYAEQIQRYVELLGRDQVYVLDADRFFEDPAQEFERLRKWLGLSEWQPETFPQENAAPRDPMPAERRASLSEYFKPYDDQLAVLIGRTPRWREATPVIPTQRRDGGSRIAETRRPVAPPSSSGQNCCTNLA